MSRVEYCACSEGGHAGAEALKHRWSMAEAPLKHEFFQISQNRIFFDLSMFRGWIQIQNSKNSKFGNLKKAGALARWSIAEAWLKHRWSTAEPKFSGDFFLNLNILVGEMLLGDELVNI